MATQSFNKWVKATALALALAVPALSQAAYYNSCEPSCNPCDPCQSFCDMDFKVGVDFIYWRPCVDDLEYATIDTFATAAPLNGQIQSTQINSVSPKWAPGFRVYLGVPGLCYDFDLTASYTWIYSGTTSTTSSATGIGGLRLHPWLSGLTDATQATFGLGRANYSLHYNEWDVLFSYRIACNPCHSFVPHFGIAGIVTDSRFRGVYIRGTVADPLVDGVFSDTADYWGVGLRVGSDYEYKFSRCLTAFARAQGTILAGEAKNSHASALASTATAPVPIVAVNAVDSHKSCHLVPGYHLAVGVQYDDKMCDMDVFFRVGYEFLNWWNMPNQRTFVHNQEDMGNSGTGPSTSASVRTLGFQGLFVGAGVSF